MQTMVRNGVEPRKISAAGVNVEDKSARMQVEASGAWKRAQLARGGAQCLHKVLREIS